MRNYGGNERLQQKYDPEKSGGGGGGGGGSSSPDPGSRDQAQETDKEKTTKEWEDDKLPKE
jgi:hypothetical protein